MPVRLAVALALVSIAAPVAAQVPVTGTVVDGGDGQPLPGATVLLVGTDSARTGAASGADGSFRAEVAPGAYRLQVSFVGYTPLDRAVTVRGPLVLGEIRLAPDAAALGEVEVGAARRRVEVRGDTTAFNADAFPVNPDSDVEDLLRKLPGVVVENGGVTAEGEAVRRVLVDGREFFGGDVQAALKTLPAEIVQEIQVFDRQSEASQFSGFDDGDAEKTINIVTRPGMQNGQFGRAYAGGGPGGEYLAGGNVTALDGDRRVTVVGIANNVDQQNFATEDLLGVVGGGGRRGGGRGGRGRGGRGGRGGSADVSDLLVGGQDGVTRTTALGVSYSDRLLDGRLDLTGSYVFNATDGDLDARLTRAYTTGAFASQVYAETDVAESANATHRVSLRAQADPSDRTQLVVQPWLSVQDNVSSGTVDGTTRLAGAPLAQTTTGRLADGLAVSAGLDLLLRRRFARAGRTLTLGLGGGLGGQSSQTELRSLVVSDDEADALDQRLDADASTRTLSAQVGYTEPVGEGGQVQFSYRPRVEWGASDRLAFQADGDGAFTLPDAAYTSLFDQTSVVQRAGIAYRLGGGRGRRGGRRSDSDGPAGADSSGTLGRRGERGGRVERGAARGGARRGAGLSLQVGLDVQHERLTSDQSAPTPTAVDRAFWSLLPSARLRTALGEGRRASLDYRVRTRTPSAAQLQDVVDAANPLQLTAGTPGLVPSATHTLRVRVNGTDAEGGSVVAGLLSASYGQSAIASATTLATVDTRVAPGVVLPAGAQLTRPVNLDGRLDARALASYGRPIPALGSNGNVSLGASYARVPGLVNGAPTASDQVGLDGRVFLGSAVSERFDVSAEYGLRYTAVTNAAAPALDRSSVRHLATARLTWLLAGGLVVATDLRALHTTGLDASVDPTQVLWGARVGYAFLSSDLAEVSLSVSDLLGQQADVDRTVTDLYVEDTQANALGRYVMLNLSYKLRNFGL